MLEKVDLSKKIGKKEFKEELEKKSERLALLQRQCKEAGIPIMIVFEGFGAAGKGTQINRLIQPMDPRGFVVHAGSKVTEEERFRPFLYRYWIKTPAKGRMVIFERSWYRSVLSDRFDGITKEEDVDNAIRQAQRRKRRREDKGRLRTRNHDSDHTALARPHAAPLPRAPAAERAVRNGAARHRRPLPARQGRHGLHPGRIRHGKDGHAAPAS